MDMDMEGQGQEQEQVEVRPNPRLGKTRIRMLPAREISPTKFYKLFPKYPSPKRVLEIPVPPEPVFEPRPEVKPLRYVLQKDRKKKKSYRKTETEVPSRSQGQAGGQTSNTKPGGSAKPKRQYLRRRLPVNKFNRGNKEIEFGDKFKNYFSYLYLMVMQDFSSVLDSFQNSKGWTFERFQKIASRHKIGHVFHATTLVMNNPQLRVKFTKFGTRVILDAARELWLSKSACVSYERSIFKRRLGAFFLLHFLYNCQPNFPKEKIPCIDEDIKAIETFTDLIKSQEDKLNAGMEAGEKIDFTSEYRFILFYMKSEGFQYGVSRFKHDMAAEMINLHHDHNMFRTNNSILRKEASIVCREITNNLFKKSTRDQLYLANFLNTRRKYSAQEKLEKLAENLNSSSNSPTKSPSKSSPKKRALTLTESLASTTPKLVDVNLLTDCTTDSATSSATNSATDPLVSSQISALQDVVEEVSFHDQLEDTRKKLKSIVVKDYFDLKHTMGNYLGERFYKEELQAIAHRKIKAKQYYATRKRKIEATRIARGTKREFLPCIENLRKRNFIKGLPGCSNKNFIEYPSNPNLEYVWTLNPQSAQSLNQSTSSSSSSGNQFLFQSKNSSNSSDNSFRKSNIPPRLKSTVAANKSKSPNIPPTTTTSDNNFRKSNIPSRFKSRVANKSKSPSIPPTTTTSDNNKRKSNIPPRLKSTLATKSKSPNIPPTTTTSDHNKRKLSILQRFKPTLATKSKSPNIPPSFRSNNTTTTSDHNFRKPSTPPRPKSQFVDNYSSRPNIPPSFQSNTTSTTTTATNHSDDNFNLGLGTIIPFQYDPSSAPIDYLSQPLSVLMNRQSGTSTTQQTNTHYPYFSTSSIIPSLTNTNTNTNTNSSNFLDSFNNTSTYGFSFDDPFEPISTSPYTSTSSTLASTGPSLPNLNTLIPSYNSTSNPHYDFETIIAMSPIPVETETTSSINNVNSIMFDNYLNDEIIIDDLENGEEIEIQLN